MIFRDGDDNVIIDIKKWGFILFGAALVVRLIYFAWSQSSPFLYQVSTDEAFYVDYARYLLRGQIYPYANFMDPLLSYLIAIPLLITENLHIVRLGFIFLDSINAVLMYALCLQLTKKPKAAIFCSVIYIFYSMTLIFSVFITKAIPIITLLLLISYFLLRAIDTQSKIAFCMVGMFNALLFFLGAGFLLLSCAYFLMLILKAETRKKFVFVLLAYVVTSFAFMLLATSLDSNKTLFPTNGGDVFYIANHNDNTLGIHQLPSFVKEGTPIGIYHAFKAQAIANDSSIKTDKEVSTYWYKKAAQENIEYPQQALYRLFNKGLLLLANEEVSQNFYFPYIKNYTLKHIPFISFAFIFGFGLIGLCCMAQRDIRLITIIIPIICSAVLCSLFFVSARMRLPMVPFFILGCAYWALLSKANVKKYSVYFLWAVLLTLLSFGVGIYKERNESQDDRYNLVLTMINAKFFKEADDLLEEILKEEEHPKYIYTQALIRTYQGDCVKALFLYDEAVSRGYFVPEMASNRLVCEEFLKKEVK